MHPVRQFQMLNSPQPRFLLASSNPLLRATLEPLLSARGSKPETASSAESLLASLAEPPSPHLLLLDVNLPGMEIGRLLAAVHVATPSADFPIVLISDTIQPPWLDRLAEGVIRDIVPAATDPAFWELRIDIALRAHRQARDLEEMQQSAAVSAQFDRLTGVYNRDAILAMLFRETDRSQRMKSTLGVILFDVDDFGHWNSRLGAEACDEILCQIAGRTTRLLRSYDLMGRVGKDEFLVAIPGCGLPGAVTLAERLRAEVFGDPFHLAGDALRLSACFGIANSNGRSPLVVLREAEQALAVARSYGPESIQCFCGCDQQRHEPVTFVSPTSGEELLVW
jgi:two-component system, cell cycle response regulator